MKICGVIAEYDPFHRGHEKHLRMAREQSGADWVVCVVSGCFTQRGMPALLSPYVRAEMALRCGADLVLQLPWAFSVREAEYFALGGVYILTALSCVTHLSFGCEADCIPYLNAAAALLEAPDEMLEAAIRANLDQGHSYAAAAGAALEKRLGISRGALDRPNAALALSYLRALRRLRSPIQPVPIPRAGDYRASELADEPSAAALRAAILRGDWPGIRRAMPEDALPVLENALLRGEICPPERMDPLIRQALIVLSPKALSRLPGVDEGLENRLHRAARDAVTREEILSAVKTRRYTRGRISRALCHALLETQKDALPPLPICARVLGFRESARPLLRVMRQSGFPLVTRPTRCPDLAPDIRAEEIWRSMAQLPPGDAWRQSPVILP